MEALPRSLNWLCRGPRGEDNAYETCVTNNWPDYVGKAWEVQEAILYCDNLPSKINCGGSGSLPLGAGCATEDACKAQPGAYLADSPHCCRGCGLKIHLALLCRIRLNEVITEYPHFVGRELLERRRIVEADDNEMHLVCFTCIDNMMTEPVGVSLSTSQKESGIPPPRNLSNNPIEKCTWDDFIDTTTLTNTVCRAKTGEPLKSSNSTHLQGFCVNGVLVPTEKSVKDHLQ
jgi:hypothetical protein